MQYFRPFENYALFLFQRLNIRFTKCLISTRLAEKKRLLRASHAYVFFLSLSANALYDFYSGIIDLFYFHLLVKSVKGYCVFMINKIINGCL